MNQGVPRPNKSNKSPIIEGQFSKSASVQKSKVWEIGKEVKDCHYAKWVSCTSNMKIMCFTCYFQWEILVVGHFRVWTQDSLSIGPILKLRGDFPKRPQCKIIRIEILSEK